MKLSAIVKKTHEAAVKFFIENGKEIQDVACAISIGESLVHGSVNEKANAVFSLAVSQSSSNYNRALATINAVCALKGQVQRIGVSKALQYGVASYVVATAVVASKRMYENLEAVEKFEFEYSSRTVNESDVPESIRKYAQMANTDDRAEINGM